jgi:hypothetical protein
VTDPLEQALLRLTERGTISQEIADSVRFEYFLTAVDNKPKKQSRKSVGAEIAGYIGGIFTSLAVILILSNQWNDLTKNGQTAILLILTLLLGGIATKISYANLAMRRLAGLLYVAASISLTASAGMLIGSSENPSPAFLIGTGMCLVGYMRVKTVIGNLALFGFAFIAGGVLIVDLLGASPSLALITYWLSFSIFWGVLTLRAAFPEILWAYASAIGGLFFTSQYALFTDHHLLSYALSFLTAGVGIWLYLDVRAWPLLIGGILAATFGVGEFVSGTLGGSMGPVIGLMSSGLALIVASLYAFKKLREESTL